MRTLLYVLILLLIPVSIVVQGCGVIEAFEDNDCLVVFFTDTRGRTRVWTEEGVIRISPDITDGRTVITADICENEWSQVGIRTRQKSGSHGWSRICGDDSLKMVTPSEAERIRRDCEVKP